MTTAELLAEITELQNMVADLNAANSELRYQLALAREEANQSYRKADYHRNITTDYAGRLADMGAELAALRDATARGARD